MTLTFVFLNILLNNIYWRDKNRGIFSFAHHFLIRPAAVDFASSRPVYVSVNKTCRILTMIYLRPLLLEIPARGPYAPNFIFGAKTRPPLPSGASTQSILHPVTFRTSSRGGRYKKIFHKNPERAPKMESHTRTREKLEIRLPRKERELGNIIDGLIGGEDWKRENTILRVVST